MFAPRSLLVSAAPTGRVHPPEALIERVVGLLRRKVGDTDPPFQVCSANGRGYTIDEAPGQRQPAFTIRVLSKRGARALETLDELAIGEAYLAGDLDLEGDFLACMDLRRIMCYRNRWRALLRLLLPLVVGQRRVDLSSVPRHYDFGDEFYFAFLDKSVSLYSQALYLREDETLEQAVHNKLEYIHDICRLHPGSHVLDIGGGWGALEKYVCTRGVDVTMLTISPAQFAFLSKWIATHRLPCRLQVVYESVFAYATRDQYDAVTLLGVMEHLPDYTKLFRQFARLVRPSGYVYMDFAATQRKFDASDFAYRHVFPGNHSPVYLPELLEAAAGEGFEPIVLHNDRHSYYLTLRAWALNLEGARDQVLPMVGEQVYRLFRLYLWGCARQMQRDGSLQSYRLVLQRVGGRPSSEIGLRTLLD
jgi:cyclopropane-fatty-acyl-phospholipid synthase